MNFRSGHSWCIFFAESFWEMLGKKLAFDVSFQTVHSFLRNYLRQKSTAFQLKLWPLMAWPHPSLSAIQKKSKAKITY